MTRSRPLGAHARLAAVAACAVVSCAVVSCVVAAPSRASAAPNVVASLLAEDASVQPGRAFRVGIRLSMQPGWHVYWKNPGDAGLPPKIAWCLPDGFAARPIEWPAPSRFPGDSEMSYGFDGEVLLPVEIVPPARIEGDSAILAGKLDWLECAEVCLSASSELRLALPVRPEPPRPGPAAGDFAKALAALPISPAGWSLAAQAGPRAVELRIEPPVGRSLRRGYLFVDEPLVVDYAAPQGFERSASGFRLTATPAANAPAAPTRLTGVVVVEGDRAGEAPIALQVDVPVTPGDPAPAPVSSHSTPHAVWLAVAGLAAGIGFVSLMIRIQRKEPA